MPMKAVVLGRNYTSLLGMIRAAGRAGCQVTAIRTTGGGKPEGAPVEAASRYCTAHHYVKQDREAVVRLLLEKCAQPGEKTLLLPVDDFVASTIDLNQERLAEHFLFPHIRHTPGEIVRLMDKNLQKELARKAGLNVASGWVIDIRGGKYALPEGIAYPCFPKPEISFLGNKRCMRRCDSEQELRAVADEVARQGDCPLLVEQYIGIEKEYAILGFADGERVVVPDLIHMLRDGSGPHRGVTMVGEISPLDPEADYTRGIERFMGALGFTGLFDIDLYESGGVMYFNELNLRFGASGYAVTASGVNLPALLIAALTGGEAPKAQPEIPAARFVNEKVASDDRFGGYITRDEEKRMAAQAQIRFIRDPEDPAPEKVFRRNVRLNDFKRLAKKLLRR